MRRSGVGSHSNDLMLTTNSMKFAMFAHSGRLPLGVEGGEQIAGDIAVVQAYASLGVRYVSPPHSGNNDLVYYLLLQKRDAQRSACL